MKFVKSMLALAVAALASATPVVNHRTATNITNYTATNITGHTALNTTGHAAINFTDHTPTDMAKANLSPDLPSCILWETWIHWEYDIWVPNVDDIPGRCKGLWDNLPDFNCATHYHSYCGGEEPSRLLQWHFWTTDMCGIWEVEHAYREAMSDMYGEVQCIRGN